ncbi:MAG: NAD-dependent epimerase/dehydratase family protein [Bdellovibrionales bacterium]
MISPNIIEEQVDRLREKSVFITGGTGFFGKSFLDVLLKQDRVEDFKITILSRDPQKFQTDYPEYRSLGLQFLEGQVEDFKFPESRFEVILHFATPADAKMNVEAPIEMVNTIYRGMIRVLDFASHSGARSVLFSSSGAVYGPQPANLSHLSEAYTGAPQTTARGSAYGEAKRVAELLGVQHAKENGYDFKIARCFAFAGKRLNKKGAFAIGNFIRNACNGDDISVEGDGTSIRSYLYADDLIVWLLKILFDGKSCEPYNVGSDDSISIRDLAEKVRQTLGSKGTVLVRNKSDLAVPPSRYVPSIEKAKKELGLKVWTRLDDSIRLSAEG